MGAKHTEIPVEALAILLLVQPLYRRLPSPIFYRSSVTSSLTNLLKSNFRIGNSLFLSKVAESIVVSASWDTMFIGVVGPDAPLGGPGGPEYCCCLKRGDCGFSQQLRAICPVPLQQ